ncbi:MAG TPA: hypothetical protein PL070_12540, partial [Flavobacteriales bacterium]|nr:hypothetical protein [Flavobacteriales bacterium]
VTTGYDVYVRQVCAGPTYSSNSFRARFTTSIDCAQAIALDCGSFVTQPLVYETFGSSIYQGANYTQAACVAAAGGGSGAERLYRITAPMAGSYQLDITGVPTVSAASFLIAPATAGCGAGAFTCITNTV